MHNWFICKVSYEKILENGMQKKVTEPYLVDALSFTEAESRIIEEIRPFITGEFTITDIKRARISELFFNENGDRYYKIKVYFITLDEKSGIEKKEICSNACPSFIIERCNNSTGKRNERYFVRLYHRLCCRDTDNGCLSI